jgi:hypothetical protein
MCIKQYTKYHAFCFCFHQSLAILYHFLISIQVNLIFTYKKALCNKYKGLVQVKRNGIQAYTLYNLASPVKQYVSKDKYREYFFCFLHYFFEGLLQETAPVSLIAFLASLKGDFVILDDKKNRFGKDLT